MKARKPRKSFEINESVFLHHVDGLLPARVLGRNVNSGQIQLSVQGWAGKHWFNPGEVYHQEEAEKMWADARAVMRRA